MWCRDYQYAQLYFHTPHVFTEWLMRAGTTLT